ncbi:MAG: TonB-dependent receptor [Bacteroidales bacterium]|nr:TonB-dependent receptor [Bacteroidales bacterium]
MKHSILIFLIFMFASSAYTQTKISGTVNNKKGVPVFAANVYLKSNPAKGYITDFDGKFVLNIENREDTLVVSFIGFKTRKIALPAIDLNKSIVVVLEKSEQTLDEIVVTAQDPVSEQFSVTKMTMLKDVYLNPVSQGDPLKAISILPASTTINETANPSLRGSSADRTRVVLNGVPIYKPVRASQLNNQGFFSLFNPEIISKQYVYASNPPLTYGNTSAGLVEIQTIKKLEKNQLLLSASLASTGFFLSQKVKKDISFIQVYGNYQFSDAFTSIQKKNLPNLKNFNTTDAGINFRSKISKHIEFNSFNYYISEQFQGVNEQFTYKGDVLSDKKRFFTVNNLVFYFKNALLSVNSEINKSVQHINFGNIYSEQKTTQVYTSVDYKWHIIESTNMQFGLSHDFQQNKFNDSIPLYYYALSPNSPNYFSKSMISNKQLEVYLYTNWDINSKLPFSSGMRSNIPFKNQHYYHSSQLGLKYRLNHKQSILLSTGKYYNYSLPTYYSKVYNLLSSYQVALDYSSEYKNIILNAAIYYKNETGEQALKTFFTSNKISTFGIELYVEQQFLKYFKYSFSNSFINQKMVIEQKHYPGFKNFDYLIKSTIQYNNSSLFSVALSYLTHPGTFYNKVTGSYIENQTSFYKPVFSKNLYTAQYGNYKRLDLSVSKFVPMNKNSMVIFVSLNNILNTKNEKQVQYNADYSIKHFDYHQFRTVYFGVIWRLTYSQGLSSLKEKTRKNI